MLIIVILRFKFQKTEYFFETFCRHCYKTSDPLPDGKYLKAIKVTRYLAFK